MVKYVKLTPVTRISGHFGVTTRVDDINYDVTNAYTHGDMFRGIEKLMLGRDVRDAPVITSRAGGINNFTNRHVALRNIENAAGWVFPMPQAFDAYEDDSQYSNGNQPGYGTNTDDLWLGDGATGRTYQRTTSPSGTKLKGGGQLARNIVQLIASMSSHITNQVLLVGPDYKALIDDYVQGAYSSPQSSNPFVSNQEQSGGQSFFNNFYRESVVAQRILHEVLGFVGGKAPHQMSAVPGGFSRGLKSDDVTAIKTLLEKEIAYSGRDPNSNISWPLLDLSQIDQQDQLFSPTSASDWFTNRFQVFVSALEDALNAVNADTWGYGPNNFVCAGAYDIVQVSSGSLTIKGDQYFRAGVMIDSIGSSTGPKRYKLDPTQAENSGGRWMTIHEDITAAKYPLTDSTGPQTDGYPGDSETHPLVSSYDLHLPDGSNRNVYNWIKAARVRDSNSVFYPVEAGPLARLVVNGVDPDLNNSMSRDDVFSSSWRSTTANRIWTRIQELMLLIDMLIGSNYSGECKTGKYLKEVHSQNCWLTRLTGVTPLYGSDLVEDSPPSGIPWENLNGVAGCALLEAPEGATLHFCRLSNGLLDQYQQVGGTTWNGGGRDLWGNPGPIEWSIMGMKKEDTSVSFTDLGSGKYVLDNSTLNAPIVERVLRISYKLRTGNSWRTYYAYDEPKYDGSDKGLIAGQGLRATSEIDYSTGKITLEFKEHSEWGYGHVKDVQLDRYGWVSDPVPAPNSWGNIKYGYGSNSGQPNPLNILRTIRSFDPCVNSGVQLFNKDGRVKKFEVLTLEGWEVNYNE